MTTYQIFAENIKCGGCVNSIKNALMEIKGIVSVDVSKEKDEVTVAGVAIEREEIISKLASLGYPEKGDNNLISKAKSFVSCAVGNLKKRVN